MRGIGGLSLSRLEVGNVFRATFFFRSWVRNIHLHKGFPGVFEPPERKRASYYFCSTYVTISAKDDLSRGHRRANDLKVLRGMAM